MSPSGANLQPGSFIAVRGEVRQRLCDELVQTWRQGGHEGEDYDYFPQPMPMTLRRRQVASAQALYSALGIARDDKSGRDGQFERNFRFFDAPVGLMFTLDRVMGRGSLVDYGMFMQNLMVGARGHGLHTCPQAAWNGFAKIILPHIGAGENEMLVCGMSLGYADPSDPVNGFITPREPVESFTKWLE